MKPSVNEITLTV